MANKDKMIIEATSLDRLTERNKILQRTPEETWIIENLFEVGEIHQLSGPIRRR